MANYFLDSNIIISKLGWRKENSTKEYSGVFNDKNILAISWMTLYELFIGFILPDEHPDTKIMELGQLIREHNLEIAVIPPLKNIEPLLYNFDKIDIKKSIDIFENIKIAYVDMLALWVADFADIFGVAIYYSHDKQNAGKKFIERTHDKLNIWDRIKAAMQNAIAEGYREESKIEAVVNEEIKEYVLSIEALLLIPDEMYSNADNLNLGYQQQLNNLKKQYAGNPTIKLAHELISKNINYEKITTTSSRDTYFVKFVLFELGKTSREKFHINDLVDYDNFITAYRHQYIYVTEDAKSFKWIQKCFADDIDVLNFIDQSRVHCKRISGAV